MASLRLALWTLTLLLPSLSLAGGGARVPLTTPWTSVSRAPVPVRQAIAALTGVTVLEAPPVTPDYAALDRYYSTRLAAYVVAVPVAGEAQRVLLSPGASEGSGRINDVMVFVDQRVATPAQRAALVRVALGLLNVCWPVEVQPLAGFWPQLITAPWEKSLGWQERREGALTVGWSGREGMTVAGVERAGLTLTWPSGGGRCTF